MFGRWNNSSIIVSEQLFGLSDRYTVIQWLVDWQDVNYFRPQEKVASSIILCIHDKTTIYLEGSTLTVSACIAIISPAYPSPWLMCLGRVLAMSQRTTEGDVYTGN